jgi:hypothetical protein
VEWESSARCLFAQPPVLPFRSAQSQCPHCQAPLQVNKTRTRTIFTLAIGGFIARETLLQCSECEHQTIYSSEDLSRLAPPHCNFGYDVMVFAGKGLFLRHRRAEELVAELLERNVRLSASEVAYLGKKFIVYLALAHRESAPRLQSILNQKGGYILHLDGTCEAGGPMLMSSLDSLSEIVLGNVKVPSEKTQEIIPFLQEIKRRYETPLAVVHDMGAGILAAVQEVFPGVPDLICHFHFLRDLGKDLLESDYDAIRQRLRHYGATEKLLSLARRLKGTLDQQPELVESFCQSVQRESLPKEQLDQFPLLSAYSLIQWALAGKTQGQGYGFPFDRPLLEFAKRLRVLSERLEQIKDVHLRGPWEDNIPLFRLSCALQKLSADRGLQNKIESIEVKIGVFDRLRNAMRIAPLDGSEGLNSGNELVSMEPIKKAVQQFRQEVICRSDYQSTSHWKALVAQIDKYADKLFADPIRVQTPHGPLLIQPQRTNNIMERFFRDLRRGARRKSGHNSISRLLQTMLADTPLVRNLDNPQYLEVLLNGQATLEERFAQIDIDTVRKELHAAQISPERVPRNIRKLIALPAFPQTLCRLFQTAA